MTLYENERADNARPLAITINTRVPSKWRFVDLETGDVWAWDQARGRFILDEHAHIAAGPPACGRDDSDLYDVARRVTDETFGEGTWKDPRPPHLRP